MAEGSEKLVVIRSPDAIADLESIWRWNASTYGPEHADEYLKHLQDAIDKLSLHWAAGHIASGRIQVRYQLIRHKSRGYGHVVVYRVVDDAVRVLRVFHSAENWQVKLPRD